MGDIADQMIEDGMDEWLAHRSGHCLEDCRYCWEPEPKPKKRKGKRPKPSKRAENTP